MVMIRYFVGAAVVSAALIELSIASSQDPLPKKADQSASSRADAKKLTQEQEEFKAKELKKLQGKWLVVRAVWGNTIQEPKFTESWIFKEDTLKHGKGIDAKFTIDTTTRPKRLTFTFIDDEKRHRRVAAIYTFDDDELLVSLHRFYLTDEGKYPSDFSGAGDYFLRLKRAVD